ncbi:MAG: D-2-hydroxyacid dehydrogenase [Phocaeicola sp.]|nr:D-2-hydroxyacid dehydrogenase [Phocaeicola sp.]
MKIVVLDGFTLNPGDLTWSGFSSLGETVVYDRTSHSELIERATGAEVLLTNKTIIDADSLRQLKGLKYIGVLATGYNVVDIDAARELGIVVTNIPAYSTESVAQMVFAHILNITQRVGHYSDEASEYKWSRLNDFSYANTPLIELYGKKIGIIGFGNTGNATARIAQAFGLKVLAYTSKDASSLPSGIEKAVSFEQIFRECDIVSLHCPLNPDTKELINKERLSLMKKTAILINTGRGGLVNESDLAEALIEGKIFAAGIDVMVNEPPLEDNPLLGIPNCFITPHIAWATYEARVRLMELAIQNLKSYIEGKTINNVAK